MFQAETLQLYPLGMIVVLFAVLVNDFVLLGNCILLFIILFLNEWIV